MFRLAVIRSRKFVSDPALIERLLPAPMIDKLPGAVEQQSIGWLGRRPSHDKVGITTAMM
ncbi:hypothetical protein A9762_27640 [Pandoraea sp. ISTKB]|nr:hypothetical protein A9762_27640 [Pandoraea sp. ISTKB]